jgi:hypothetical protein
MNEQLAVLELAVSRLEAAGISYLITGSIALAVYATPRMTRDIDIVIDCNADQAAALASAFESIGYASPEAAREAVENEGMFNVIHNESLLKIDFIIRKNNTFDASRFARRRAVDLGGFTASVSSPEDLILAKLRWRRDTGSSRQRDDVVMILKSGTNLDWDYLIEWSRRLDVSDELQRLRPS